MSLLRLGCVGRSCSIIVAAYTILLVGERGYIGSGTTCQVVLLCSGVGGPLSHFDPTDTACSAAPTHDHHSISGCVGQHTLLALCVAQQMVMMVKLLSGVLSPEIASTPRRAIVVVAT